MTELGDRKLRCPSRGDCIHGIRCLISARCTDPAPRVEQRHWTELTPAQAAAEFGDNPDGLIGSDVILPLTQDGQECPFPYDPEQLIGQPLGQYHCPYCGDMVVAGVPHVDYRGQEEYDG